MKKKKNFKTEEFLSTHMWIKSVDDIRTWLFLMFLPEWIPETKKKLWSSFNSDSGSDYDCGTLEQSHLNEENKNVDEQDDTQIDFFFDVGDIICNSDDENDLQQNKNEKKNLKWSRWHGHLHEYCERFEKNLLM